MVRARGFFERAGLVLLTLLMMFDAPMASAQEPGDVITAESPDPAMDQPVRIYFEHLGLHLGEIKKLVSNLDITSSDGKPIPASYVYANAAQMRVNGAEDYLDHFLDANKQLGPQILDQVSAVQSAFDALLATWIQRGGGGLPQPERPSDAEIRRNPDLMLQYLQALKSWEKQVVIAQEKEKGYPEELTAIYKQTSTIYHNFVNVMGTYLGAVYNYYFVDGLARPAKPKYVLSHLSKLQIHLSAIMEAMHTVTNNPFFVSHLVIRQGAVACFEHTYGPYIYNGDVFDFDARGGRPINFIQRASFVSDVKEEQYLPSKKYLTFLKHSPTWKSQYDLFGWSAFFGYAENDARLDGAARPEDEILEGDVDPVEAAKGGKPGRRLAIPGEEDAVVPVPGSRGGKAGGGRVMPTLPTGDPFTPVKRKSGKPEQK